MHPPREGVVFRSAELGGRGGGSTGPGVDDPVVELCHLTKWYEEGGRRRAVLEDVDLRIRTGELVVLLGRSGSGKSTLLNLIAGIDVPDSGRVVVEGTVLTDLDEESRTLFRRHRIGFVFQFFNLLPTLTVEENVQLPVELVGSGPGGLGRLAGGGGDAVPSGDRDAGDVGALPDDVGGLLDAVGLADRAGSFPDRLSGGEQQRVAIARALAASPALVLADEPTGNLDAETGGRVLDLLERLTSERGGTLIIATHSREIADRGDRVLRLEGRGLVEAETS